MKKILKVLLYLFIIISVIGIIATMFSDTESEEATDQVEETEKVETKGSDGTLAYIMAKDILKQQLKAPSTAKFQKEWKGVDITYSTEKDEYYLQFWVDAQNSYGAMIRTTYAVTMKELPGDKWKMVNIAKLK